VVEHGVDARDGGGGHAGIGQLGDPQVGPGDGVGGMAIDDDHLMALAEQALAEVRTDEPSPTGH
jgi:hypothetical protein